MPAAPFNRRRDDSADERYITRREAEVIHTTADDQAKTHRREHDVEKLALDTALAVTERDRQTHDVTHEREHEGHERKHEAERDAVRIALDAVDSLAIIHAEAHEREHQAHAREHELDKLAITKAELAADRRFDAVNGHQEQISTMTASMATKESVAMVDKEMARRFEDMRLATDARFETLRAAIQERKEVDVRGEGRQLGQGATIAAIIAAVSFAATAVGLILVAANLLGGGA